VTDNIVSFAKARKKQTEKNKLGMCQHGFHKWKIWQNKQFDSKQGKLVTVYRCERCNKEKVKAH
tara:strand:+ start:221 stop:412 length:192 start_codon:yes stop_codon:yes gene_type:complete